MKHSVFFGLGWEYDKGSQPAVGLNRGGAVLEVHKNEAGHSLYYRVGRLQQAAVDWRGQSVHYDSGVTPRIALNTHGEAVEVHKAQVRHKLWCHFWRLEGDQVRRIWKSQYDAGVTPAVALNDAGLVVEVHRSQGNNGLWYNIGRVDGDQFLWFGKGKYGSGEWPSVAVNNDGTIIEVHTASGSKLAYRIGRVQGKKIVFGQSIHFAPGVRASVALTADGQVIVTFLPRGIGNGIELRTGRLRDTRIEWLDNVRQFDTGKTTSVAAAGTMSIEVHEGEFLRTLWFSTSIITDRAKWMENRLRTLGGKRLGDLVLPASHDAGMYLGGFSKLGKTQELTILEQLRYGIRYFDLRPMWLQRPPFIDHIVIAHGDIIGPSLATVLKDIRTFALEGHREVVILKFSHFSYFDNVNYVKMAEQIRWSLEPWLVTSTPGNKRLADVTLSEYVKSVKKGPAILVVVDRDFAIDNPKPGFWVYRDWDKSPAEGDLRVFDQYSKTVNLNKMRGGQFAKFRTYDGKMKNDPRPPCDFFLLSWTLTPVTFVWEFAKQANRRLGQDIRRDQLEPVQHPNQYGRIMNLLYVDYVESARVTDIALFHNGERDPVHVETRLVRPRPVPNGERDPVHVETRLVRPRPVPPMRRP